MSHILRPLPVIWKCARKATKFTKSRNFANSGFPHARPIKIRWHFPPFQNTFPNLHVSDLAKTEPYEIQSSHTKSLAKFQDYSRVKRASFHDNSCQFCGLQFRDWIYLNRYNTCCGRRNENATVLQKFSLRIFPRCWSKFPG